MLSEKAQYLADSPAYPFVEGRPWSAEAPHGMTVRQVMVMRYVAALIVRDKNMGEHTKTAAEAMRLAPTTLNAKVAAMYADAALEELVKEPENPHE